MFERFDLHVLDFVSLQRHVGFCQFHVHMLIGSLQASSMGCLPEVAISVN
jgi:hypothetical protein